MNYNLTKKNDAGYHLLITLLNHNNWTCFFVLQNKKEGKSVVLPIKGPGGSLLIADIYSENVNKTKQELNTILKKNK